MSKKPFPSFQEFSKRRVRLPADVLAQKYVGLFFGIPFITLLSVAMVWIMATHFIARPETYHAVFGAYEPETVRWWRNLAFGVIVLSGIVGFVANAKDPGTGPTVALGRVIMPIARLLVIGRWLSAAAERNASIPDRELYERFRRVHMEREHRR